MKNIITEKSTGTLAGNVFFGNATVQLHDKRHKFLVCSHLKEGQEMEFRAVSKVKAGWNTIYDFKAKAEGLWYHINKTTLCVQVKVMSEDKKTAHWFDVYNTKGGLWSTVDVLMLDTCKVGDVHHSAPKMYCHATFTRTNAKFHGCLAFVMNESKSKAA